MIILLNNAKIVILCVLLVIIILAALLAMTQHTEKGIIVNVLMDGSKFSNKIVNNVIFSVQLVLAKKIIAILALILTGILIINNVIAVVDFLKKILHSVVLVIINVILV